MRNRNKEYYQKIVRNAPEKIAMLDLKAAKSAAKAAGAMSRTTDSWHRRRARIFRAKSSEAAAKKVFAERKIKYIDKVRPAATTFTTQRALKNRLRGIIKASAAAEDARLDYLAAKARRKQDSAITALGLELQKQREKKLKARKPAVAAKAELDKARLAGTAKP